MLKQMALVVTISPQVVDAPLLVISLHNQLFHNLYHKFHSVCLRYSNILIAPSPAYGSFASQPP